MKCSAFFPATAGVGLFIFSLVTIAQAQGTGTTSGPAVGTPVLPQSSPDASGVAGPKGSKNGPAPQTNSNAQRDSASSRPSGSGGSAAGVAGPAGSKNGPPQRSGSSSTGK
jgi:hypothetical protein